MQFSKEDVSLKVSDMSEKTKWGIKIHSLHMHYLKGISFPYTLTGFTYV